MNRLVSGRLLAVFSLLLLAGYPVALWWNFGWPQVAVGLYHTATAVYVGFTLSRGGFLARKTERKIAVVGGKEDQLLQLAPSRDEFAEGLFYAGIRIGAEEAATRAEELGAAKLAEQLRAEVRAAMPETDERLRSWQSMRERETGGAT